MLARCESASQPPAKGDMPAGQPSPLGLLVAFGFGFDVFFGAGLGLVVFFGAGFVVVFFELDGVLAFDWLDDDLPAVDLPPDPDPDEDCVLAFGLVGAGFAMVTVADVTDAAFGVSVTVNVSVGAGIVGVHDSVALTDSFLPA